MTWRQALTMALVMGMIAAGIVWWLESFERDRLAKDWQGFIDSWEKRAGERD